MNDSKRGMKPDFSWVLDAPVYNLAETSRLVGLSKSRVRRWFQGYSFSYDLKDSRTRYSTQPPVIPRERNEGTTYASFLDLIDLLFVKGFLSYGISLQKVRRALDEVTFLLDTNHFAKENFFTDGHNIYLELIQDDKTYEGEAILQLLTGGQWVIASVIKQLAKKIDFHEATRWARRWYPLGRNGLIVIDPLISFGRPTIIGKGVPTSSIYDFYLGEDKKIQYVTKWLDLSETEAKAAVEFEQRIAA